jgi:hypothetical protein
VDIALRIADLYLADQMQEPSKRQIPAPKYEFVDLAESELIDKVGAYRMHGTRMIWGVSVVEGSWLSRIAWARLTAWRR